MPFQHAPAAGCILLAEDDGSVFLAENIHDLPEAGDAAAMDGFFGRIQAVPPGACTRELLLAQKGGVLARRSAQPSASPLAMLRASAREPCSTSGWTASARSLGKKSLTHRNRQVDPSAGRICIDAEW